MSKKKICFIAQFPPPIHGLSKAVDTLYKSSLHQEYEFEKIDIKKNKKILSNLKKLTQTEADLFYFTISQTKGGNLRDLIILKLLELQKKKCLIHLHGGYYRQLVENELPMWMKKMNYRRISKLAGVIVLSDSLRTIFKGMLPDDRIYVVMNCVDDDYLPTEKEIAKKLNAFNLKEVLHVLYLSNFIKSKGYPAILDMAKIEKERMSVGKKKRFHFDFAGCFFDEKERRYFKDFILKNNLNDIVTYHGVVSGKEKRELLLASDIFALPTRYPKEGQPISILEAMGNGMFIVTTDHAGIPDIIKNRRNGIIMKKDMPIQNVYNALNTADIVKVGKENRDTVLKKFKQDTYISNMKKVFQKILSEE